MTKQPSAGPEVPREIARSRGRTPGVWLAALLCALPFAVRVWDPDEWWHLATGRWVAEHHAIPYIDPFSFTAHGQQWLAAPWLSDLVWYAGFAAGGFIGLGILKIAIAFVILAIAAATAREVRAACAMRGGSATTAALLAALAAIQHGRLSRARAETIGAVFLALAVYVAVRAWRRRDASAWLLVPATALWVPAHAGSVIAIGIAALALASAAVAPAAERLDRRALRASAAAAALVPLVVVATQNGRDALHAALSHNAASSPLAFAITSEWRPTSPADTWLVVPALMTFAGIATLARAPRKNALPLALALLGVALAAQAARHLATATLLAVPTWAAALATLERAVEARASAWLSKLARAALVVALPVAHIVIAPAEPQHTEIGFGAVEELYPGDTLATLRRLPAGRTMNDYDLGGYLIWNRIPGGVFWDGRNVTLYTEAQIRDTFLVVKQGPLALERLADKFDITYAIARLDGIYGPAMITSPEWIPVQHGVASTLFVRKSRIRPETGPTLDLVRWAPFSQWMDAWYAPLLADRARAVELEDQLVLAFSRSPRAPVLDALVLYVAEHDRALAARVLERVGRER